MGIKQYIFYLCHKICLGTQRENTGDSTWKAQGPTRASSIIADKVALGTNNVMGLNPFNMIFDTCFNKIVALITIRELTPNPHMERENFHKSG